jgi:hypothetical protein
MAVREDLGTTMDEETARFKTPAHVARRVCVLVSLAAVANGDLHLDPARAWIEDKGLWRYATGWDKRYLTEEAHGEWATAQRSWLFDAAWPLLWALGAVERLDWPTRLAPHREIRVMVPSPNEDIRPFVRMARLRPPSVLLDQVDLYWRLYFLRLRNGERGGAPMCTDVVLERVRALWWLAGGQREWGDPQFRP